MAPNPTSDLSGRISASGVKRQPAARRWIRSPGCDHLPGMRRAISTGAAGSFILDILRHGTNASTSPPLLNVDPIADHPDVKLLEFLFPSLLECLHPGAVLLLVRHIDEDPNEIVTVNDPGLLPAS